jgi:hypothetical protein
MEQYQVVSCKPEQRLKRKWKISLMFTLDTQQKLRLQESIIGGVQLAQ